MRVLITNMTLKSRSGTETFTRDLALGLQAAGDEPVVYCPAPGDIAREIANAGIEVVDHLGALAAAPDIIHGHHYVETYQAMARFPDTRAIFVIHDGAAWHDAPPFAPQLLRYVAVDLHCRARLEERYMIRSRLQVICNSFDPARFPRRAALPGKPGRALVFSHYATHSTFLSPIEKACGELGIPLDIIGSRAGKTHPEPGGILHNYDLVFAIARSAIEAMASGAAVVLCGSSGLGPLVTRANVETLRPWNFGKRMLANPHDKSLMIAEIKKYNPADALAVSDYIRANASLPVMIEQYRALYREVMAEPPPPRVDDMFAHALSTGAQHAQRFELAGIPAFQKDSSRILPPETGRDLTLEIAHSPQTADGPFTVGVKLKNEGIDTLSSDPPFPVYLSYHWLTMDGRIAVREGNRSPLNPTSIPGRERLHRMAVLPPPAAGKHRLRVTLVQEFVMWFDELTPPVMAETEVEITPRESADTKPAA